MNSRAIPVMFGIMAEDQALQPNTTHSSVATKKRRMRVLLAAPVPGDLLVDPEPLQAVIEWSGEHEVFRVVDLQDRVGDDCSNNMSKLGH